ncbi:MAG: tRNA-specific adenosine deaminase [Chlamydiae bacterium RIFCSPLOWO2_12_FULL_49_12]|nr:MAG: tRNA-specific adenosine deaminase [Chlamydiae bacterium RIFCSPLOWO2_12_FULL_49_12]
MAFEKDIFFINEALIEAKKAYECKEVPVGAVLVFEEKVIARAHNLVEAKQDAAEHAELVCLKKGSVYFNNWRLLKTTLYCTLEPCAMCAGALLLHRVERLVWGAPDPRQGAHGSWVDLLGIPHPFHTLAVSSGILEQESKTLLKSFFQSRRSSS